MGLKGRYDVVIVGSGPAGAGAAKALSGSGLETLIVERDKLPRYKMCSGIVFPSSRKFVDRSLRRESRARSVVPSGADQRETASSPRSAALSWMFLSLSLTKEKTSKKRASTHGGLIWIPGSVPRPMLDLVD